MFWAGVESKTLSRHVVHLWTRLGTARIACVQNALLRSGSHVFRWNTRSWVAGSEFSPDPQNDPTRLTSSLSIFIMNPYNFPIFSTVSGKNQSCLPFFWVVALVPRRSEKSCRVTCEWPLVPFWVGQYNLYILR